ncbi:MAG TPA: hypothetical protein VN279_12770, partial [Rhodocyclaceae bacterium]|nr:hypothetical protein [Rhodocyclaceae bacterium]
MDRQLFSAAPAGVAPVPAFDRGTALARGEAVVRRARALAIEHEAELMAVHVIDSRTMFESDGPCG